MALAPGGKELPWFLAADWDDQDLQLGKADGSEDAALHHVAIAPRHGLPKKDAACEAEGGAVEFFTDGDQLAPESSTSSDRETALEEPPHYSLLGTAGFYALNLLLTAARKGCLLFTLGDGSGWAEPSRRTTDEAPDCGMLSVWPKNGAGSHLWWGGPCGSNTCQC